VLARYAGLTDERKIPATMSTQHPDNANLPEWCEKLLLMVMPKFTRLITPTVNLVVVRLCGILREKTLIRAS
jgi:hypothetical protein